MGRKSRQVEYKPRQSKASPHKGVGVLQPARMLSLSICINHQHGGHCNPTRCTINESLCLMLMHTLLIIYNQIKNLQCQIQDVAE